MDPAGLWRRGTGGASPDCWYAGGCTAGGRGVSPQSKIQDPKSKMPGAVLDEALPIAGVYLMRAERVLYLRSDAPLTVLSSAVVGGELARTRHILNMRVPRNY